MTGTVGRPASVAASPSRAAAVDGGSGSTEGAAPSRPGVIETGAATGATQVKPSGVALFDGGVGEVGGDGRVGHRLRAAPAERPQKGDDDRVHPCAGPCAHAVQVEGGVPAAGAGEAVGSGSTETASERSPPDTGMADRATAWVWSRAVPVGAALRVCSNAERVFSTV